MTDPKELESYKDECEYFDEEEDDMFRDLEANHVSIAVFDDESSDKENVRGFAKHFETDSTKTTTTTGSSKRVLKIIKQTLESVYTFTPEDHVELSQIDIV